MSEDDQTLRALREALVHLTRAPFMAAAAEDLAAQGEAIAREMGSALMSAVPAFTESGNPEVLPQMAEHVEEHTGELVRLLSGGAVGDFGFVREHARRRAEQRFPLEATLHAYRCGHRVYSRWIRQAVETGAGSEQAAAPLLGDIVDFTIEYTDAVSTVAAAEYVAQIRHLAEVAGDERARLMDVLLSGHDESDGRIARVLREAGYLAQRLSFCVVVAQPVNPEEMTHPARARRLADSVAALLAEVGQRQLVDVRDAEVVAVVSAVRRLSGWSAPRRALAAQIGEALSRAGNAVLVGVSNDVPSTGGVRRAHEEARIALRLAGPGRRVVQFGAVGLSERMLHLCREELARGLPAWAPGYFEADDRARGALSRTVQAYADADMNLLRTARALHVHPNTLYARMERIGELSGVEPRSFAGLTELLLVAQCREAIP